MSHAKESNMGETLTIDIPYSVEVIEFIGIYESSMSRRIPKELITDIMDTILFTARRMFLDNKYVLDEARIVDEIIGNNYELITDNFIVTLAKLLNNALPYYINLIVTNGFYREDLYVFKVSVDGVLATYKK